MVRITVQCAFLHLLCASEAGPPNSDFGNILADSDCWDLHQLHEQMMTPRLYGPAEFVALPLDESNYGPTNHGGETRTRTRDDVPGCWRWTQSDVEKEAKKYGELDYLVWTGTVFRGLDRPLALRYQTQDLAMNACSQNKKCGMVQKETDDEDARPWSLGNIGEAENLQAYHAEPLKSNGLPSTEVLPNKEQTVYAWGQVAVKRGLITNRLFRMSMVDKNHVLCKNIVFMNLRIGQPGACPKQYPHPYSKLDIIAHDPAKLAGMGMETGTSCCWRKLDDGVCPDVASYPDDDILRTTYQQKAYGDAAPGSVPCMSSICTKWYPYISNEINPGDMKEFCRTII